MNNPECKCLKPDGGGTKCPPQHIALCIRGKDKECYGECITVPNKFRSESYQFTDWLKDEIENKVAEYVSNNFFHVHTYESKRIEKINESVFDKVGTVTFRSSLGDIHVRYSFEFKGDDLDLDFSQKPTELTF